MNNFSLNEYLQPCLNQKVKLSTNTSKSIDRKYSQQYQFTPTEEKFTMQKYVTKCICLHFRNETFQGYLKSDHPDQIKGAQRDLLREFAKYFNKALDYRYVPLPIMNSRMAKVVCRIGTVSDLLDETNLCGGATDDYYSTYWVRFEQIVSNVDIVTSLFV